MSFTGKIRLYLILAALLPVIAVMLVVYFQSMAESERSDKQAAAEALSKFERYDARFTDELKQTVEKIASSQQMERTVLLINSNRAGRIDLSLFRPEVDFVEIVDSNSRVLASAHRPGLVGERMAGIGKNVDASSGTVLETVEVDTKGAHPARGFVLPIGGGLHLYAGKYLSGDYLMVAREILGARVNTTVPAESGSVLSRMTPGELYSRDDSLIAVIDGSTRAGFYIVAHFPEGSSRPVFRSFLKVSGVVAAASVVLAILLGFYITSHAKREIDNLVTATSRIAEGDFSTPVMAYEEGEFSQLADSFSDMMLKLKTSQSKLAMAEKIAAWQAMGRKLAHEVKNPLTPISISIDDLRRSYSEHRPEFEQILKETTATTKNEINRLTKLIDQFVDFARMNPPEITSMRPDEVIGPVKALYRSSLADHQLKFNNMSLRDHWRVDPEQIRQVLINLIKNSFESAEGVQVTVDITDSRDGITIQIEDTGPGFPDEVLHAGFQPYLSKKADGTGLGLVISQRIVHDHGGTIELYNRKAGGAGVSITLPFSHG